MSLADLSIGPSILLVAGEASGDTHGAELIRQIRRRRPDVRCLGAGGPRMAAAGQEELFDLTEHAVVGLVEVLKHYPTFKKLFNQLLTLARQTTPEIVVLIDFPGFNLRLAADLRRLLPQTKIVYYISPQVWAWKAGRAQSMARMLDLVLVIFGFEKEWFKQRTPEMRVEWVGHPLLDRLLHQPEPDRSLNSIKEQQTVALLPGSRATELRKHLPILLETAKILVHHHRHVRFLWIAPDQHILEKGLRMMKEAKATSLPIDTYVGYQLSHLYRCDLALLASGSVSLECAAMDLPQILFYKVHPITYFVGRLVTKIKYLSIVNILAHRAVVPEFVQHDLQPEDLANKALELLSQPEERRRMNREIRSVLQQLGQPGASERAAKWIIELLPTPSKLAA